MATLAHTVETAICALLAAGSTALLAASPQPADSNVKVPIPTTADVNVTATPSGSEFLFQTGLYQVDVLVSATNKPRSTPTPDDLIGEAAAILAQLNTLPAQPLVATFAPYGLYVWGVIPSQQVSSTVENDNRISTTGIALICRFNTP